TCSRTSRPTTEIARPRRGRNNDPGPCHRSEDPVMPLFDHFHPPLYPRHQWESFHSNWATRIADGIEAVLPPEFQVEEHTHAGPGFGACAARVVPTISRL